MNKAITIVIISLLLSITLTGMLHASNRGIYIAPDYLASFYDYYTLNILNTRSLSMGNATVAVRGGIESALINPASFKGGELSLYVEGHIKNEVEEMNTFIRQRTKDDGSGRLEDPREVPDQRQTLEAGTPAVTLGLGFSPSEYYSLGASFSMPQTVRYSLFGRLLKTGAYLDRFPTMRNFQGTFTFNTHIRDFSLGMNAILNRYTFSDIRIEHTFDRVSFGETVFRLQPGVLYEANNFSVGASYKLPSSNTFKVGNIPHSLYHTYEDLTLPGVLDAGFTYRVQDLLLAGAIEYEQTSQQYDGFDDRLKIKAGVESNQDKYFLRGGFIYVPAIYSGRHNIITGERVTDDEYPFEFDVEYDYLIVRKTEQLILTGGFTYPLPKVDFSLGAGMDVLENVNIFHLSMSFNIKLEEILREP